MQSILPSQTTIHSLVSSCFILSLLIPFGASQSFVCFKSNNYTQGSLYESNLKLNLNTLASNITPDGFYMITSGASPDMVYGLLQCRGDVSRDDCQICANNSAEEIIKQCPNQMEAVIYYDNCMLHYAYYRFFSTVDTGQALVLYNVKNTTSPDSFDNQLQDLLDKLSANAASDPKLFSTGTNFTEFDIYGLVQCTRDLSKTSCLRCLKEIKEYIYYGKVGGQVLTRTCLMRYETYSFFESSVSPPPPPALQPTAPTTPTTTTPSNNTTTNSGTRKSNNRRKIIIATSVSIVTALLLASIICVCLLWRKFKRKTDGVVEEEMKSIDPLTFDLNTLRIATNNFSASYKLGQGGFGEVYKGKLPDGQEIAVKRLSEKSHQGFEELKTEVMLVAKLQHRNLANLLGFCLQEQEKLLVYEYLPNGSLDKIIFDEIKCLLLDWDKRYNIIIGIARGLLYLHQDSQIRIIHRDLKASNILLDTAMNPKISDFGLARLFVESQIHGNTKKPAGTYGYMAPEYIMYGNFSTKSDVFSFGVLVLEIVTGQKNSSFHDSGNLVSYAWQHWNDGTALKMADPILGDKWPRSEILKCIQLGLLCVQQDSSVRPTMSEVLLFLNTDNVTCQVPSKPAYFVKTAVTELDKRSETCSLIMSSRASQQSWNEVTITDMDPR